MNRKEIEKLCNVKLHRRCREWEGYKVYEIKPMAKHGSLIGWPQFVLEKNGCIRVISGGSDIGGIFMDDEHFWKKHKQRQAKKEISPNRIKRVAWSCKGNDLPFEAIGILDNELFHILGSRVYSENPAIKFIIDQANLMGAPDKGFPELFILNELKKLGAKHIRYAMYKYPKDVIF